MFVAYDTAHSPAFFDRPLDGVRATADTGWPPADAAYTLCKHVVESAKYDAYFFTSAVDANTWGVSRISTWPPPPCTADPPSADFCPEYTNPSNAFSQPCGYTGAVVRGIGCAAASAKVPLSAVRNAASAVALHEPKSVNCFALGPATDATSAPYSTVGASAFTKP